MTDRRRGDPARVPVLIHWPLALVMATVEFHCSAEPVEMPQALGKHDPKLRPASRAPIGSAALGKNRYRVRLREPTVLATSVLPSGDESGHSACPLAHSNVPPVMLPIDALATRSTILN